MAEKEHLVDGNAGILVSDLCYCLLSFCRGESLTVILLWVSGLRPSNSLYSSSRYCRYKE